MSRVSSTWVTKPVAASQRSAEIRGVRAVMKAQLRGARTQMEARHLAAGFLESGVAEVEGMRVSDLLWACRRLSVRSAWRLLVRAGVPRESKLIGELTARQRTALAASLRDEATA
jgi:hypothetical protein